MRLLTLALCALLVACTPGQQQEPEEDGVRRETLRWKDPAVRERHAALRAWIEGHSDGFRRVPLRRLGNFLNERWCGPGVNQAACDGGSLVGSTTAGDAWRELQTLFYPSDPDLTFGLGVAIGRNPTAANVGVQLSAWSGGASIVGDHFTVRLLAFDATGPATMVKSEAVELGDAIGLTVVDTPIAVRAPGGGPAELARLAASPASLLATAKERLAALQAEAEAAIADDRVQGFDEGPYEGGGIPPERTPRSLTNQEKVREVANVRTEVTRRIALVERNAEAFHRALLAELPVELLTKAP